MESTLEHEKLRHVAGAFATGIAVALVMDLDYTPVGMTINSFLSVSLDPPLILFSAANDSKMLEFCHDGSEVSFNILSEEQREVSNYFAGMSHENKPHIFREGKHILIPNAMAWYKTQIDQIVSSGDHKLIICKVIDCGRDESKTPIIFYNGYRNIGSKEL